MDEGDRPGTDGDPAERTEESNEDRAIDSSGSGHSDNSDDSSDLDGSSDLGGSGDLDGSDGSDDSPHPSDLADSPNPIESVDGTESVGRAEESELPPDGDAKFPTDSDAREERVGVSDGEPSPEGAEGEEKAESLAYRFRHDREGALMWVREMLSSVAIVLVIGLILFGVSGVWPPMVAVESGSMEPNMEVGDLVFVTEPGRLAPDAADNDVGVVTYEEGRAADYRTFGAYGSVIIYRPPGRTASPIIHRAMFHVEEGENWYDRADDEYHGAAGCAELRHCPAPHDGFITLGDNNAAYDQANGLAAPVKAEWLTGVARVRVPYLGYVRLIASGQAQPSDVLATTVAAESDGVGQRQATDGSGSGGMPTVSGGGSIASAAA